MARDMHLVTLDMTENERIAIAARLHVALRRKTGRVTDTEWMAANVEYASEIVRFARAHAADTQDADLAAIAAQLESAMEPLAIEARVRAVIAAKPPEGAVSRYLGLR